MTDFVNSIDSWPKAVVAIACIVALTVITVAFFKYGLGQH